MWELQSLRAVERHEDYIVLILIQAVDVGHKSHLFEKSTQCRFFIAVLAVLLISRGLVDQLVDILESCLSLYLILGLQALSIARLLYDLAEKIRDALFLSLSFEILDQRCKGIQLRRAPPHTGDQLRREQRFIKSDPALIRRLLDPIDRRKPDPALRHIDDTAHSKIILPVIHSL